MIEELADERIEASRVDRRELLRNDREQHVGVVVTGAVGDDGEHAGSGLDSLNGIVHDAPHVRWRQHFGRRAGADQGWKHLYASMRAGSRRGTSRWTTRRVTR